MHHGGAGTTAAAFVRSAFRKLSCRTSSTSRFRARLAFELGVSPRSFRVTKLSVDRVVTAIQAATTDGAMRQRAAEIAAQIRSEDGVARSVELFEAYVCARSFRACENRPPVVQLDPLNTAMDRTSCQLAPPETRGGRLLLKGRVSPCLS